MYKVLFLDTETTGVCDLRTPYNEDTLKNTWPYITELAYRVDTFTKDTLTHVDTLKTFSSLIAPSYDTAIYPEEVQQKTGISINDLNEGAPIEPILKEFCEWLNQVDFVVAHNTNFDMKVLKAEFLRWGIDQHMRVVPWIDTMWHGNKLCNLRTSSNRLKFPTLTELYQHFFKRIPDSSHRAMADVDTMYSCFLALVSVGELSPDRIRLRIEKHVSSAK